MRTRLIFNFLFAAIVVISALSPTAWAVDIPIVNPGFDAAVLNPNGFIYEDEFYTLDSPIPDHTFTLEDISGNGDNISAIADSATGAQIFVPPPPENEPATVSLFGYTGSPGSGILHDTRDYLPGQGPDGPSAFIGALNDQNARGIFQTLETEFAPNTTYKFTAEVSDRRFGPDDNVAFPSGGDLVPKGIQLSLSGDVEPAGMLTFTQPAPGETSLVTFVFTTGSAGTVGDPTGPITLILRAQGFDNPGGAIVTSQAVFDNLTLDASPAAPPTGVPGDYNGDNVVDAADYTVWRDNLGASIALPNEDATPDMVTAEDYGVWKDHFGETAGGSSFAVLSTAAVPEPANYAMLLIGLLGFFFLRPLFRAGRLETVGG